MDHYISKAITFFSLIVALSLGQVAAQQETSDFSNEMEELLKKNKQMIKDLLNDNQMEEFNKKLKEAMEKISTGNGAIGKLKDLQDIPAFPASLFEDSEGDQYVYWSIVDEEYILKIMALGTKDKPLDIKIEQRKITVKLDTSALKQSIMQASTPPKEEFITRILFAPSEVDVARPKVEILTEETWVHFKKK